ncbi:gephyrin-like molybdotransferase Glp [Gaiella sp.]|uniref:molybdopterin molybdotransferase MoeA n=1 Tax=Gaiella sp. TaxID=2663207 RepID=UPI003983CAF9
MNDLLSVAEALARVLNRVEPLDAERVALTSASSRVSAEDVVSAVDVPPFRSSSMDGYAVRAADLPARLAIVDRAAAGRPSQATLTSGQAIEISTGAVVPDGADTVVPIERVEVDGDAVTIPEPVPTRDNIREPGGDVEAGSTLVSPGDVLTPARLGALAACGVASVLVHRVPHVTIVVTGTELRPPGVQLAPGQIYESNGVMLAAVMEEAGATVTRLAASEDTEDAHAASLEEALASDVVVTSGGVSVGPHDLVRRVQARLGVEEVFWGVAMRPGKPLAFGCRGRTLVFGLPGNPVSALVGALLFVRPALLALVGNPDPAPPFRPGILAAPIQPRPERDDFVRARVTWSDEGALVQPIVGQESHMIMHTSAATGLVWIPRGVGALEAGSRVRFLPL